MENTQTLILSDPVTDQDHVQGRQDAPVTLVEYGDYECPDCFNAQPMIQRLQETLGDRLRFAFRHFPQSSIHPHASAAAEAAEAAGEQGKFWVMHKALFDRQRELAEIDFGHLALTLGLEIYKFETSRSRDKHRRRVAENFQSGLRNGVKGTPTFFINGIKYLGAKDFSAMLAAMEAAAPK